MATILMQERVCDGVNVRCLLSNQESVVFHFLAEPVAVQSVVDAMEVEYVARWQAEQESLAIVQG